MDWKLLKRIGQVFGMLVVSMLLFFVLAGSLQFTRAWLVFAIYFMVLLVNFIVMVAKNASDIARERSETKKGTKGWDIAIASLYAIGLFGIFVAAGLDARAGIVIWGLPVIALGSLMFVCGDGLVLWAMLSNKYFYTTARIDPRQKVAVKGPYAKIRHPGYVGILLFITAMPMILGSPSAMIIALVVDLLILLRTYLEDNMLMHELKGYKAYAKDVRYRLIPYLW